MEAILNFSSDFDIRLFDVVVGTFYNAIGYEQENAQQILTRFQNHTYSWQRVPKILEESTIPEAKYLGLQILERFVRNRWKTIPYNEQIGRASFSVKISDLTSLETGMRNEWAFVNKLNMILVQILKREWPHNWPSFIPELVQSSQTNPTICENNMAILKLLSEEIFDFSAHQIVQAKINELKNLMCEEFSQIFQLCLEVLEKEKSVSLIQLTLETLLQFLSWIPLAYIFETSLIDILLTRLLETSEFRSPTLRCLAEIAAFNIGTEYDPKFVILFAMVITAVNRMIPLNTNIVEAYQHSQNDREFILSLSLFLTNFLSNHLPIVETVRSRGVLLNAHLYLIKITQVEEREVLKICLEYWIYFVAGMYSEIGDVAGGEIVIRDLENQSSLQGAVSRKDLYEDVLSSLRLVVIETMVKPEELLAVESEGEMVPEIVKECDIAVLHRSMRELLVYLTHLDVDDTEDIMTEKLLQQVDGREWSWNKLNTLCWAIGSISGTMSAAAEGRFLLAVIKDLLGLCKIKQGKDDRAVVASNIMYIVGQYPQFLKTNWKFLKVVARKLFEFMHEPHKGVQAMACDTFIKIAQKCKRQFIIQQTEEDEPFLEYILRSLEEMIADLPPRQVHLVYEAIGYMISAQTNKSTKERQIADLMETSNCVWDSLIAQAGNVDILDDIDNLEDIMNVLKTNSAVCTSIGGPYLFQLGRIYLDMLGLYRACGGVLNQALSQAVTSVTKTSRHHFLRRIREEILKLLDLFIKKADDPDAVNDNLVPPLLESVLGDYANNSGAYEPEALDLLSALISLLKDRFRPHIATIMDSVFETILSMINNDFNTEFPEYHTGFYKLLRAINSHCFDALSSLQPRQFKLVMDSIMWGMKHTLREISDLALTVCYEFIETFSAQDMSIAQDFYGKFLLQILGNAFWVVTDGDHKSGFRLQSQLISKIIELIQTGRVSTLLFDPALAPDMTNSEFLNGYCLSLLQNQFPELPTDQTKILLSTLFQYYDDLPRFKSVLRDFLVQLKEFSQDDSDLYLEEREKEAQKHAQKKLETALRIPGMVRLSQLEDEEEDHDLGS